MGSAIATLLLITLGGLVRATRSGLGCGTDWPDCGGELLPSLATRARLIEFSHRASALVVILLLGSLAVLALARHRHARRLVSGSVGAFGLVLFQALLGMVVVKLELEAESVVLHLAAALALFAVLIYLVITSGRIEGWEPPTDRAIGRQARGAAAAVLVLLLVGSYVTGRGAGLAFQDWPLMNGQLLPDLSIEPHALHFLHRFLALVVGVIVVLLAARVIRRKRNFPLQAKLAHSAIGLFAVEVAVGAANVWTDLDPLVVTLHLFLGAAIWGTLVALALVSHPATETVRASSRARAALEAR